MRKRLVKHGNSLAIVIEKPVLELLGVEPDTEFEVVTNGRELVLTPVRDPERDAAFQAALARANELYEDDLRKLAE